jgi:hypothetical protein
VSITVNPKVQKTFAINIRVPTRDVSTLYAATPKADGISLLKVNGRAIKPVMVNGYATLSRTWRAGDTIEFVLPMAVQRVHADERIAADVGRVALRYGPLVYNIEKVDQDIDGVLPPDAPLSAPNGAVISLGVTVITGALANGTPMMAIPHYARFNRNPAHHRLRALTRQLRLPTPSRSPPLRRRPSRPGARHCAPAGPTASSIVDPERSG